MIKIRPFRGYRAKEGLEDKIACVPYDVINHEEALKIGKNPYSFVHVIRPEIDMLNDIDPYSQDVYNKAKDTLQDFIQKEYLVKEEKEIIYIYRQIMNDRVQNGIVGCVSIDDYDKNRVKRHEFTRVDKEMDRIKHFYTCGANTEPVFLFYKDNILLKKLMKDWTENHKPIFDFVTKDGVQQILWVVDDDSKLREIQRIFAEMKSLYIADGHHRTESSYKVGLMKREENPDYTGDEEFNFFMSVIFPGDELFIMPYNRIVRDLNGYSIEEFIEQVKNNFYITSLKKPVQPEKKHEFTIVFKDRFYSIKPKEGIFDPNDVVASLDTSILQNNLLSPILGIDDPRTNERIEFCGGENMMDTISGKLEEEMKVAFLLYPTQIEDIINVSDADTVMPPKSTWFEPKLKSGLFIHTFE